MQPSPTHGIGERPFPELHSPGLDQLVAGQKEALELALSGAPLEAVLSRLLRTAQQVMGEDAFGAIFLLGPGGRRLHLGASAGVPEIYLRAVEDFPIGSGVTPCAAAVVTARPVVIEDLTADAFLAEHDGANPRWRDYLDIVKQLSLRSCWIQPIRKPGGAPLGVLAVYHDRPQQPAPTEMSALALLGDTAALIVERYMRAEERVQTQEALRLRTEQFETLFRESPLAIYLVGADFRIREVNPVARPVFGDIPDLIGRDFGEVLRLLWPSHYAEELIGRFRRTLETGEPYYTLERTDERRIDRGVTEYYEWQINRIRLPEGGLGVVCHFRDVSERKRMEDALRVSEERLRLALEAGRMGVGEWNLETGAVYWSSELEVIRGFAPGSFGGTLEESRSSIHPDDRARVQSAYAPLIESGGELTIEYRVIRPDGGERWMEDRAKLFPEAAGAPRRMIGVSTDITERKRAESMSDAFSAMDLVIHSKHEVASLVQVALREACAALGMETAAVLIRQGSYWVVQHVHGFPARIIGMRMNDEEEPHAVLAIRELRPVVIGDSWNDPRVNREHMRKWNNRAVIVLPLVVRGEAIGAVFFNDHHGPRSLGDLETRFGARFAASLALAIENARLIGELQGADRTKDEFLAMLAHELRNPLAPIRNAAELLARANPDPTQAAQAAAIIGRQTNQLTRLVDDLLDVSRLTQGRIVLQRNVVLVSEVIEHAMETVAPLLEEKRHKLSVAREGVLRVAGDPARLSQCIVNLATNAAKYTDPGGDLRIESLAEGDEAVIRISDNGIGISAQLMPRIFDLFVQGNRGLDRAQGGLGIGLSVVKRLVEMHGGRISAFSPGAGQGSTFEMRLPLVDAVGSTSVEGADIQSSSRRILVVDDNMDATESLSMVLTLDGHQVVTANSGEDALEKIASFGPQVVLLDIGLPGMDGYEVARRIRSNPRLANVRLIAFTGYGQAGDRRQAMDAGFDDHLVKPLDFSQLRQALAHGIRR